MYVRHITEAPWFLLQDACSMMSPYTFGVMHFRPHRHDKRDSIMIELFCGGCVNGNMVGVTRSLQGMKNRPTMEALMLKPCIYLPFRIPREDRGCGQDKIGFNCTLF